MTLYLFRLEQNFVYGYDTYSDCVVVAADEEAAKKIHPATASYMPENYDYWQVETTWCGSPEYVTCELLGPLTSDKYKAGDIVCKSFHAG